MRDIQDEIGTLVHENKMFAKFLKAQGYSHADVGMIASSGEVATRKRGVVATFVERLDAIGITVTLSGNFPWVYMDTVNGERVLETYKANHGFTAFFMTADTRYKFSDRREVFRAVRKYITRTAS
ncbi:MAG: hypothetical protein U9Q38_06365 [Thermodesulfobacteriota bacterium]|nr:hypothetical protein [Thermodesulfobacteriota bacterium]